MNSTGLSNCFTDWFDKRICGNLVHENGQVNVLITDARLTQDKKNELQKLNEQMEKFIEEFNKKNVGILRSKRFIERYSGIKTAESKQTAGKRIFLVMWVHPILLSLRFSRWLPAKDVKQNDLGHLCKAATKLSIIDIKPEVPPEIKLPNVPQSIPSKSGKNNNNCGLHSLDCKSNKSNLDEIAVFVREDSDPEGEFDDPLDSEYLQQVNWSFNNSLEILNNEFNERIGLSTSLGSRIHSTTSGYDDSGFITSTPQKEDVKEEADNGMGDRLNQTTAFAESRRKAFREKSGPAFKSLPSGAATPKTKGAGCGRGRKSCL